MRATSPEIAVLPVRFPVPNTESVGTPSGAGDAGGGSNRKSAPTYGVPLASATAATSIRSR